MVPPWRLITLLSVGMLMLIVVEARQTEVIHSATSCLASGGKVTVKCKNDNQKISLKSVGYAYAKDCTQPAKENDCVQTSKHLSKVTQTRCDGKQSCEVVVLSIAGLSKIMAKKGPGQQSINSQMSGCAYNKRLQPSATMNVFQVKYACQARATASNSFDLSMSGSLSDRHSLRVKRSFYGRDAITVHQPLGDFQFCKQMKRSVDDLVIATESWPVKSVTNPTCGCTFEAEDQDIYVIHGIAHCNGSVTFVTEETTRVGKVNKFEYVCKDKLGENIFTIGHRDPWKIKFTVDVEKSDEISAYEIRFFNILPKLRQRRLKTVIKVDCVAGSLWLKYSVKLILMIVLPVVGSLLLSLIIIYCICKSKRRNARDWRARHVRLPPRAPYHDMIDDEEGEPVTPINNRSRSSSVDSYPPAKDVRVDPEGNVDDLGEFAAMMHKKNEDRRRKELEKRQGYQGFPPSHSQPPAQVFTPSPARTPPPVRAGIQPNRRTQSIGNLRSAERDRRYAYADNLNMNSTTDAKPLAYSKSASQSRASVRSLKRRAPPPPGPPQVPATPDGAQPLSQSLRKPLYATSTPSIHRVRSRQGSQPALPTSLPPTYQPHQRDRMPYATPYATSTRTSSAGYSDIDPANNSDDDMPILRPNPRPNSRPKPAVAPKPRLSQQSKYNGNQRYPSTRSSRNVTPSDIRDLQQELDSD